MEFCKWVVISVTTVLVLTAGVTGCTLTVMNNNQQYYDVMRRCIDHGGTFVPGKGQSEAACVNR